MSATVISGIAGYSGHVASFLAKTGKFFTKGFSHSFTGTAKQLLTKSAKNGDEFYTSFVNGGWKSFAAAGAISIPTAVMNLTNFFDDGRRMREIASGESNFYTDRDAATKTWGLSALGLGSSTILGVSGLFLGGAASISPLGRGLTIASGVIATGSLIGRNLFKKFTIDLPFQPNTGFGLLSLNKPVFRVEDPSSPYYMMSHMLEKSVKNREIQDRTHGEAGSGYLKSVEDIGLKITNFLTA